MPQTNGLSEIQESILLAIWKLRGIGTSAVEVAQLQSELTNDPPEELPVALQLLHSKGFIEIKEANGKSTSLTPLGLAILRKIEEDRLQELK
jgi:hypothetical protein